MSENSAAITPESPETKVNPLGVEPVGKLMRAFAIPSVVAFVISSLYNIVDQLFIGWGVGYLGNAATNIIVPLTTIVIALALLIGDGAAAFMSLNLGVGNVKRASKGAGNSIFVVFVLSVIMLVVCSIFLEPICYAFGATDNIIDYCLDYGRIIVLGFIFSMCSGAFAALCRADGRPKTSMLAMVIGCVANMILDPVFIFVFHWGVKGAAWATIIGQFLNFLFLTIMLFRMKNVPIHFSDIIKLDPKTIGKTLSLGLSSFITQCASVVVIIVMNRALVKYGNESIYGSDISLAVYGIVMKINMLITGIPIGIAGGSQPIYGYNYSAGNVDRVTKTLKIAWGVSTIIMIAAFIIYHLFPRQLIGLFGSESELYNQYAVLCFRVNTACCFLMPTSAVIGIFFQALGKPVQALIVSLIRQVLVLIPAIVIFGMIWGMNGVLAAGPFGDAIAAVVAAITLLVMWKKIFSPEALEAAKHT